MMPTLRPVALVRGANDIASAVAARLAEAGYAVLHAEGLAPAVTRRGQAFANATFNGMTTLEGVTCHRVDHVAARLAAPLPNGCVGPAASAVGGTSP